MKAYRTIAIFLCGILIWSFSCRVKAAPAGISALEQCASELSLCADYKYYKNENTERYLNYKLLHPDYTAETVITYVNIGLDHYFYSNPVVITNPHSITVLVNKYKPLPSGYIPRNLETVSSLYSRGTQRLVHPARLAFEKLCAAASKNGYVIMAASSYRSFNKQAEVYAGYQKDPATAVYLELLCARPGYSEHHTGLAVDIIRANMPGTGADANKWLLKNAHKYGFILRYPAAKEGVTGYTSEPWHLRYLGSSLAAAVYKSGLTYDEYYAREIDINVINDTAKDTSRTAIGVSSVVNIAVDGFPYQLTSYRVLSSTYFKLRDIAVILSGTMGGFDIDWNDEEKTATILKGFPYPPDSLPDVTDTGQIALVTTALTTLQSGDMSYEFNACLINGAYYYQLGDILGILDLAASEAGSQILISTAGFTETQPADTAFAS